MFINHPDPDLSVVIPCLNEEDTLGICLQKLLNVSCSNKFKLEVIVADNGSNDNSLQIANSHGANVINVRRKGYGSALQSGIEAAKAPFIIMADADDSYDFMEVPKFYAELQKGFDLVQGCRLPKGGGKIKKGAMPWSHRYIGNPLFTYLVRSWFKSPINDVYCGMRGFTKDFYQKLKLKSRGMEFATEMIIKAANLNAKTIEIPITLHKDGRIQHPPHLKTFRDGWRTLRFFFICAPSKLFLFPGILMMLLGIAGNILGYNETQVRTTALGVHTMLGSALFIICGYQAVLMHSLSLKFTTKFKPSNLIAERKRSVIDSKGFNMFILSMLILGLSFWFNILIKWIYSGLGQLDYAETLKLVVPGTTMICIFFQSMFFSFFQVWLDFEDSN
jgi:glycosyltransferase involved in cell wall biosynthesis